ncbi:MAG: hypothetical protein P1P90_03020 [Patescibacteria group bacterium]|nr:hypothetical protein [Patescibacteria group bacterium]
MSNEKQGLKIWQIIFIVIGMITTAFILFISLIAIAIILIKPWGINVVDTGSALISPPIESTGYDHPLLNPQQEALLESAGVDPSKVPTSLTPAQQQCAIDALGEKRAMELVNGAAPSLTDITQAKHCLE